MLSDHEREGREAAPVVVGVDGSPSCRDALDWAAAEAAVRGRALWLVHACPPSVEVGAIGAAPLPPWRAVSSPELEAAARRAQAVAPEIEVVTCLVAAGPVPALLGQRAELIVLGSRGRRGVLGVLAGSVSATVSARAACPVVVVPPFGSSREAEPGPSRTRVVVGVDGSDVSGPAIAFAVRAAAQRGVGLTAVHAWTPPPPSDIGGLPDDAAALEAGERDALGSSLSRWRARCPAVDVERKLVRDEPAHALAVESVGASLLVVGSRGRGPMTGLLFGSVSHRVLHHARCPVAVVRPVGSGAGGVRAA